MAKSERKKTNSLVEVLVVEDSEVEAKAIRDTLTDNGYKVSVAKNGVEGLAQVKKQRPTLVICDIVMPILDGYRMSRAIKQDPSLKDIPVMLLTWLSGPEEITRALECGANNFLIKPIEPDHLLTKVSNLLANLELKEKRQQKKNGTEVYLSGHSSTITSEQGQILDLLIATFENILHKNRQLTVAQTELRTLNRQLESKVDERTKELRLSQERLEYLATHDGLTDLPNRGLLMDRLAQALSRGKWNKRDAAVLFIDLDHFKRINDSLGHDIGDLVLKEAGKRLLTCIRKGDTVSRIGGDEFVLVLTDMARGQDAHKVAEKILDVLSPPCKVKGNELFITPSIGISVYPDDGEDPEALLKNADVAMYRAKDEGRNNYQHYSPDMNAEAFERLALENSLRKALEHGEFVLHYQPRVDLKTFKVIGMEALLRWQHPDLGLVSPTRFIPLAEETGLIVPIGEWVLREACAQNKAWQSKGYTPIRVAVNFSARQFKQPDLTEMIREILKETGLDPDGLEVELTEGTLMRNEREVTEALHELHDLGIEISIDDFGTGYSSLGYLKRFPIQILKIDQSFVRDITNDPDAAAIVTAITTLGQTMKMKVVAEGVETEEQLRFLRSIQCDAMQGYLYSRPLTVQDATDLLSNESGGRFTLSHQK